MNIYLYNCPNTFNYGSMMMGENFIKYYNKVSGINNRYFIETPEEINVDRLIEATGYKELYPVAMNSMFLEGLNKYDYILSYLNFKNTTSEFLKEIDLVVVLGGDDFTEDYGWKSPVINALKFNILAKNGLKVIMLGQTMGPYKSFRKPLMKKLLNKIDKIYPRDPLTFDYLKKLGVSNISIIDDLALLPLSRQEVRERTKKYITYCPSELIFRYSKEGGRQEWIQFNFFMINKIIEKYPDKKIVLLAHVLSPDHVDDRKITNELYTKVKEEHGDRVIVKNTEMYPYQVRNYIQESLFTISSRMHPVISSIQCEIPSIALSYSTKYWGIIGQRYELEEYIIDVRYLDYNEMRHKFIILMDKIEKNSIHIQEKMREKNDSTHKTIIESLKENIKIRQ